MAMSWLSLAAIVLGGDEVLPFQVQHLQVVAVGLPQVTQVGPQCQFQLVALQACVLHGDAGIAPFALAVAVEEVEPNGDAPVESEVVAAAVAVDVILVERIAVSGVQAHVGIVA